MKTSQKTIKREQRRRRVRAKVFGTQDKPRLAVFRSNAAIYAQLIDDASAKTLVAADSRELKKGAAKQGKRAEDAGFTRVPESFQVGQLIAKKASEKGIKRVAFDRGGYLYAGRVKALADGARDGGLEF